MAAGFLYFIILTYVFLCEGQSVQIIDQCYPVQSDFAAACNQILGGIADGGRCFFLGSNISNQDWSGAWNACHQRGGTLAQIHTEQEFNKIVAYATSFLGPSPYLWLALHDNNTNTPSCTIDPTSTSWYDQYSPNPNLIAGNTWVRYRACENDGTRDPPPRCFLLWHQGQASTNVSYSPYGIGDGPCGSTAVALCQYTNVAQNFTKTNLCLKEMPIETASAASPNDCAQICGSRGWCRSFNYIKTVGSANSTCQLFPWSIYDTCPNCAKTAAEDSNCSHYNYIA